jgi:hypothetical protein
MVLAGCKEGVVLQPSGVLGTEIDKSASLFSRLEAAVFKMLVGRLKERFLIICNLRVIDNPLRNAGRLSRSASSVVLSQQIFRIYEQSISRKGRGLS